MLVSCIYLMWSLHVFVNWLLEMQSPSNIENKHFSIHQTELLKPVILRLYCFTARWQQPTTSSLKRGHWLLKYRGKQFNKNFYGVFWISFITRILSHPVLYSYANKTCISPVLFSMQSPAPQWKSLDKRIAIPCATVDITTDGVDDTTAVTAMVFAVQEGVEQLLLLPTEDWEAVITTGCFWVVEAMTDVGTSFVTAA